MTRKEIQTRYSSSVKGKARARKAMVRYRATSKGQAQHRKDAAVYRKRHPDRIRALRSKYKVPAINIYSNGDACCSVCRIADIDVLCLDHINNDGAKHRKLIKRQGSGFYAWLCKNDYPIGLQVLCANCNLKKEIMRKRDSHVVK